ncbi:MAG TPA: hypothetical protein VEV17_25945 [Bryobacteraceae bacterium]|nr:hypothetical protein [Bryobacteraceae bacterium]
MKVVVRSSSLAFTILSILLNAPLTRVRRGVSGLRADLSAGETPDGAIPRFPPDIERASGRPNQAETVGVGTGRAVEAKTKKL